MLTKELQARHAVKSILVRSFYGPYLPAFRMNIDRHECGKIRTRKTLNMDAFYAMRLTELLQSPSSYLLQYFSSTSVTIFLKKILSQKIIPPLFVDALFIVNFEHVSHLFQIVHFEQVYVC